MKRLIMAIALVSVGAVVAPQAWRHWQIVAAADDPVALSQLRLDEALSPQRVMAEIDAAITARDSDLAASFVALAMERGIVIPADRHAAIRALAERAPVDAVEDFGHGLIAGDRDSGAAMAGAVAGDLIGFGDLRDLAAEGRKWLGGEAIDPTVLALAAGGLAISAATIASIGAALPARNGLSVVKAATKAKLLSPALTTSLARLTRDAVHRPALTASLAAAAKFDLAASRTAAGAILKPAALTRLTALGQDAGGLYARAGQRGLRQVLAVADDAGDIAKASKLAVAKGGSFRAVLKVLGRGALVLGALSMTAMGWLFALVGYAIAVAMLAQRFGWWLGRRLKPAPRPQTAEIQTA
ncbi:hypothetical protein [Bosea sp. PAMC 26642]|uniref:hypothetical protein n=1 Tax=Bosea sp. (strain PAMC 26642) TaxID=1792307 RepID=UPI0007701107|nr:hypothetical protein [Bosea sp. PAMC 26642]AMJ60138.1 hypothetical protein AXW83_07345 [Bosea sp. PAMC 26642]